MTAQIIMMPGASAPPVEATAAVKSSSDVVAHLEDLLERARAGDIIDVAVVILSPCSTGIAVGTSWSTPCCDLFALHTGAHVLAARVLEDIGGS